MEGMMVKTAPLTTLAESGWTPDNQTRKWCEKRYPTLDVDATFEKFELIYEQNGHKWASWSATFKNFVNRSVKNNWDGAVFVQGHVNPQMENLVNEARQKGFRMPHRHESVAAYRTALNLHEQTNVVPIRRESRG